MKREQTELKTQLKDSLELFMRRTEQQFEDIANDAKTKD